MSRLATAAVLACLCTAARAQTDEIQVYDAEINEPGRFNLVWHDNYTLDGRKVPEFPGGIVPDRALNGVTEWAWGATEWLELGLYLPLYTVQRDGDWAFDGWKLRALFVSPHAAERRFFWGLNFELSFNRPQWDPHRNGGEIRPIVGVHLGRVDLVLNPIVDTSFDGLRNLDLAPAARVAYHFDARFAAALEQYADFGAVGRLGKERSQQTLFAVLDWDGAPVGVELGVGAGLTDTTDRWVAKLMLLHDF